MLIADLCCELRTGGQTEPQSLCQERNKNKSPDFLLDTFFYFPLNDLQFVWFLSSVFTFEMRNQVVKVMPCLICECATDFEHILKVVMLSGRHHSQLIFQSGVDFSVH